MLTSPETYRADPENAWRRLAGRLRKAREIAVLMEVAAWREREAQARDVPRGRVLKDEAVDRRRRLGPAQRRGAGALRSIPNGFERSKTGRRHPRRRGAGPRARPENRSDAGARRAGAAANGASVELLKVLLKAVAEEEGVAPKIIATVDDLEAIAERRPPMSPPLNGWRRAAVRRQGAGVEGRASGVVDGRRAGGDAGGGLSPLICARRDPI